MGIILFLNIFFPLIKTKKLGVNKAVKSFKKLAKAIKLLFSCKKKAKIGKNDEEQKLIEDNEVNIEIANNLKELKKYEYSIRTSRRTVHRPIEVQQ